MKLCYVMLGKSNWASNVKNLLDNADFSDIWITPNNTHLKYFHIIFKQRLIDQFKQTWFNSVQTMPILYMFKEFKNVFEFSMYLDNVPKTYRIAFTKLRLSSHPLRIETGRYGNDRINQNQRYCLICGSGDIEDEYHFVCICKPYETIRKHYLKKTYYVRPSVAKFIDEH